MPLASIRLVGKGSTFQSPSKNAASYEEFFYWHRHQQRKIKPLLQNFDRDPNIKHQMELLKSIDGVGEKLAINMIVITEGFTRFDNARQFNCYAGLAPFQYTSGKSIYSKSRVSQRANKHIKSLLHLCAVSAGTRMADSEYREYYERRKKEGEHPMSILNVIRAKIVSRMFAVINRDSLYTRDYAFAS